MFFGGNENTLVLLLLRFRFSDFLDPVFFLSALLYIFYTAIFHIPDNSLSFISVPSISLVGKSDEKKIGLP